MAPAPVPLRLAAGLGISGALLVLLWLALHHEPERPRAVYHEATPEAQLRALVGEAAVVARGRELFSRNCTLCHGVQGQGLAGPNLRDEHWLGSSDLARICESIANGNPPKGMAAWHPALRADDVHALAAFIASLQGSEDGSGKAPQGTRQPMAWRTR